MCLWTVLEKLSLFKMANDGMKNGAKLTQHVKYLACCVDLVPLAFVIAIKRVCLNPHEYCVIPV